MTLTFKLDIDRIKMNLYANYLGQRLFSSKVIVWNMIFFNPRKDSVQIVLFSGPLISWHHFGRLLVGKLQNNKKATSEKMWLTLVMIVHWSYCISILVGVLFCLCCIVLSDQTVLVVGLFLQYIFLHKCRHKHDIAFGIKFQTGRIVCYILLLFYCSDRNSCVLAAFIARLLMTLVGRH